MSPAGDFITRDEYDRNREADQRRFDRIETVQASLGTVQATQGDEIKQIKDLIVSGFHDVRLDVQGLKSLKRRFVEGLAAGAGISFALYQAIHAALGGHL